MTAGSIAVPSIVPLRVPSYGKLKNIIDTFTPIELKTETPNAEIFFTIDGSKPDPFAALGADRNTIKYTKPFKLREGKKSVKALGISRDGTRQSHIVTKSFDVEKHEHCNNQEKTQLNNTCYDFIDELERERKREIVKKRGILKKIVTDTSNLSYRSEGGGSDNETSRYQSNTKYLGTRFSNKNLNYTVNDSLNKSAAFRQSNEELRQSRKYVLPDSSFQSLRLQRETDFLKCIYCFAARPNDPQARHCTECGQQLPQIPQTKLVTPQSNQMGTCFYCRSVVPFNTNICVICEMPITPQLQPQASVKLQGKCICSNCTTANPSNYTTCVACDFKLVPGSTKIYPVETNVPQYPLNSRGDSGKNTTCSQCFRMNRGDARFCDWCGAKPQKQLTAMNCLRCGSSNNPYSKFCISCGSLIQPPTNQNASVMSMGTGTNKSHQHQWLSSIDSKAMQILNKQYSTCSTQTYGLFYTSAKGLENEKDKAKFENKKVPLLTAVSAGKGYWRQQMDHICAHLKAFAQNNSEFRVLVGEPRLGKLNSAKVDIDSSWCTITASFPIRNHATGDTFNSSAAIDHAMNYTSNSQFNNTDYELMKAMVKGKNSSLSDDYVSYDEDDTYRSESKHRKSTKKKSHKLNDDKLSGEDRQMVKEISKQGRGRPKEIRHLLNEGANPNAVTRDGVSMLHAAIRNKHYECIPILLEADADIKAKVPPKGNTVLHEAVMLGNEADSIIKMLIDFGANPKWKNSKNETPFELAIKENNQQAINILGSQVGSEMINTYLKTKDGRP